MVSIGSKSLLSRNHKGCSLSQYDSLQVDKVASCNQRGKKEKMGRRTTKNHDGFRGNRSAAKFGRGAVKAGDFAKPSKHQKSSVMQTSFVRKQVDPETTKYFAEITNVIEGSEIDIEERSVICGNALEEARGKEVELATDYIISHTLQTLLGGCSAEHLCGFLRNCATNFAHIAMDRSGSHVIETALKALASHLQDPDTHILIEETLTIICKMIVTNPIDIMCNCYGSHVLRSLLCLCRGVPLDSSEFHSAKPSTVLAERLNIGVSQRNGNDLLNTQQRFPELLHFIVLEMLNSATKDMATVQCNQYSSLVLQTALKMLAGEEQLLLHIIPVILRCTGENVTPGNLIQAIAVPNILSLIEQTAFSHLMEVVLEVAPNTLYDELFVKVFRNSLFLLSSHPCGNFVVQALISHARTQDQMESIWADLGARLKDLLDLGRSGVVASVVAACQRLHSHENEFSRALTAAVCAMDESPRFIVPRILFLDNYFRCENKPNWSWPNDAKMHILGSLMLQSIFGLPCEFIQPYITSITSLEDSQTLEASKDCSGSRVIEAFLCSNASGKQKRKLVAKLGGHFGELSVHPSGAFTVDKCFGACNMSLRETIVSELLPVQKDLAKTKQGPYLLKKLDVEGFARSPDQWKSRQAARLSTYEEFYHTFGPSGSKVSENKNFLADVKLKSRPEKMKDIRKEIDSCLANVVPNLGSRFLAHQGSKTKFRKSGLKRPRESANLTEDAMNGGDALGNRWKKKHSRKS